MTGEDIWRHKRTGRLYKLMHLTNTLGRTMAAIQVVYVDSDDCIWSKPINDFSEKFTREKNI